MYGYCALLAVAAIGLAHLSRSALLPLVAAVFIMLIPGAVGVWLTMNSHGSIDSGMIWLRVSLYLSYAVGVWVIFFVIRGWSLYFKKPPGDSSASSEGS
jgi:hypothetical protein